MSGKVFFKNLNYCGMFLFSAGDNRFVAGERVDVLKCECHTLNAGDYGRRVLLICYWNDICKTVSLKRMQLQAIMLYCHENI